MSIGEKSPAGRCGILTVMNLAAAELRSFQDGGVFNETEFLFKGGYPELHARPEIDSHFWYGAYLASYLERDVRNILNVGSLRDFDRFLRTVAARTGQMLSYSDLARDVGIAPNTAKKCISSRAYPLAGEVTAIPGSEIADYLELK